MIYNTKSCFSSFQDELRTLVKEEQAIIDSKIEAEKKSQAHAKKSPTKTSKGHFHINVEVQKMHFLGLISSQNKIYCSILHLHSKHMVVFYKR